MAWYRTGTVAVTLNSNTVTGTGTSFSANSRVGDAFLGPDGGWYEVTNVVSNTVLAISPPYRSAAAAAGTYAIVPVQGYTKGLADQVRQILNDWGTTLASLGTVATENVVPVNKGGTGSITAAAARTNLGLGSAAVAELVGLTASGAAMEYGSNANGEYWKFANGLLICTGKITTPTLAANSPAAPFQGTYPHLFAAGTQPSTSALARASTALDHYGVTAANQSGTGANSAIFLYIRTGPQSQIYEVWYTATGRWK